MCKVKINKCVNGTFLFPNADYQCPSKRYGLGEARQSNRNETVDFLCCTYGLCGSCAHDPVTIKSKPSICITQKIWEGYISHQANPKPTFYLGKALWRPNISFRIFLSSSLYWTFCWVFFKTKDRIIELETLNIKVQKIDTISCICKSWYNNQNQIDYDYNTTHV